MDKRKIREQLLQEEREAHWERVRTEERYASHNVMAYGIGRLKMQLIASPAFEEGQAWEVREASKGWLLYHCRVISCLPEVKLVGYDQVDYPQDRLADYYSRVAQLSIPLAPYLNNAAGCDGTSFQFAVFGGCSSSWRFKWWSEPPENWRPLVEIAYEMFGAFYAASKQGSAPSE